MKAKLLVLSLASLVGCLETSADRYDFITINANVECSRPYLTHVASSKSSNNYYCKSVDNFSGTDCIETSTIYKVLKKQPAPSQTKQYDKVLWGDSSIVEVKKVTNECESK